MSLQRQQDPAKGKKKKKKKKKPKQTETLRQGEESQVHHEVKSLKARKEGEPPTESKDRTKWV